MLQTLTNTGFVNLYGVTGEKRGIAPIGATILCCDKPENSGVAAFSIGNSDVDGSLSFSQLSYLSTSLSIRVTLDAYYRAPSSDAELQETTSTCIKREYIICTRTSTSNPYYIDTSNIHLTLDTYNKKILPHIMTYYKAVIQEILILPNYSFKSISKSTYIPYPDLKKNWTKYEGEIVPSKYAAGSWVGRSSDYLWYHSEDNCVTWNYHTNPKFNPQSNFKLIGYMGGKWIGRIGVYTGSNTRYTADGIYSSSNFTSWSQSKSADPAGHCTTFAYAKGVFWAMGGETSPRKSTNGSSWTADTSSNAPKYGGKLIYANGYWLTSNRSNSYGGRYYAKGATGSWSKKAMEPNASGYGYTRADNCEVDIYSYGMGKLWGFQSCGPFINTDYAAGNFDDIITISVPTTYTGHGLPAKMREAGYGIDSGSANFLTCYGNIWLTGAWGGLYNTTGTSSGWKKIVSLPSRPYSLVCANSNMFVICGTKLYGSIDGINWTCMETPGDSVSSLFYANGKWILTCKEGTETVTYWADEDEITNGKLTW